jgi:hypothetical protein
MIAGVSARLAGLELSKDWPRFPLSLRERVGVRGNTTSDL